MTITYVCPVLSAPPAAAAGGRILRVLCKSRRLRVHGDERSPQNGTAKERLSPPRDVLPIAAGSSTFSFSFSLFF